MSTLDRVKFTAASGGTGAFVVSAAVTGWLTPAGSGMANAQALSYIAFSSDQTQWEYGHSTYTVSGTSIARSPIGSSNSNATVSFTNPPTVATCLLSEDYSTIGYTPIYGGGASQVLYENASGLLDSNSNFKYDTSNNLGVKDSGATFLGGGFLLELESTFASGAAPLLIRGTNAGAAAYYEMQISNGTALGLWRMYGSGYTTSGLARQNGLLHYSGGAGGLTFQCAASGSVYFAPGNTLAYTMDTSGELISAAGIAATSTTTGDLQISGGVGIQGALYVGDIISFGQVGTGATTALLGTANCPAVTGTAPYAWMKCKSSDGSTVYVPAWK